MATESTIKRITQLSELREEIINGFNEVKDGISDIEINEIDLDGESLRTPKLYNKYLVMYTDMMTTLKRFQDTHSKLYLERWKYYQGKQKSQYYAEYGAIQETILKSDMDLYLRADDILCVSEDILNILKQHVSYLEKTLKEISNRGYHIKTASDWRRFQSGSL